MKKSDLEQLTFEQLEKVKKECKWHVEWYPHDWAIVSTPGFNVMYPKDEDYVVIGEGGTLRKSLTNAIWECVNCPLCNRELERHSKTWRLFEKGGSNENQPNP